MGRKAVREGEHKEIGERLKTIRIQLGLSLDDMVETSGVSRSYLSEFERGVRLPNSRYLRFLFERYGGSIHYVYSGIGDVLVSSRDEGEMFFNFGKYADEIKEMLFYMTHEVHTLFDMLTAFTEYKMEHPAIAENMKRVMAERSKPNPPGGDGE